MKYLTNQPIVFGNENNKNYEDTWDRVFGKKRCKQDSEQSCDIITDHEEEY